MALSEHLLQVTFPTRTDALRASRSAGAGLEVFVPSRQRVPIGRQVRILVAFGDATEQFELLGRVSFVRGTTTGTGAEPGIGVAFDGEGRHRAAEMLAFCTGLASADEKGIAKRFFTKIRCRIQVGDQRYNGEVVDLSKTGVFVGAPDMPRLKSGSKIAIQFKAGLLSWGPVLEVRVAWNGEKRGQSGFGARFAGNAKDVADEVNKYLHASSK